MYWNPAQIEKLLPNVGSLPASAASSPSPWSFPSPWLLSHLGRAVHGPRGWCPVCCLFRTSLVEVVDDCVHFPFDKIYSTGSLATCTTVKRTTSSWRTNCCNSSVFRCIFPGFMIVHCCVLFLLCVSCLKDSTQPLQNIYLNLHKVSSINKNISKFRSSQLVNQAYSVLILPIHPLIS